MTRGAGQLCRALFRLSVVMSELGLVQKHSDRSQLAFTTWEMLFFQRFRLFSEITSPPPLPYTDFEAMLRGSFEITELLSAASFCFKKAKGFIDDAKKSGVSKNEGNENSFAHEALMLERATALLKTIVAGNVNIMRLSNDKLLFERHKGEASAAGQVGSRKGDDGENKPKRRMLLVDFPYCNSFPVLSIAD